MLVFSLCADSVFANRVVVLIACTEKFTSLLFTAFAEAETVRTLHTIAMAQKRVANLLIFMEKTSYLDLRNL